MRNRKFRKPPLKKDLPLGYQIGFWIAFVVLLIKVIHMLFYVQHT